MTRDLPVPRRRRSSVLWLIPLGWMLLLGYWAWWTCPLPLVDSWWHDQAWDDPLNKRHRIADALLHTGWLDGRTRDEVVAMLGEPPPTTYFRGWSMVYNLGRERAWLGIDSEWLVLKLDDAQRVRELAIVRD